MASPSSGHALPGLFTIGHSNHPLELFIAMLKAHGVERVADVRTLPRSRHNPQFNMNSLRASLAQAHIGYTHLASLGGLRRPRPDSPNTGWRNPSFRGFADYMQTPEFSAAIDGLIAMARSECIAVMCAEALPWRCHRSLIADALMQRGLQVRHIMGTGTTKPHVMTAWAHVAGGRITYPLPASHST